LGINTNAGPLLWKDLGLTSWQFELFMGMISIGAMFGCALASSIVDYFGHRVTFFTANVIVLSGLSIICTGSIYGVLLLGRALVGIGIGISLCIGPIYLAEISPPVHRGWLVSWSEVSINIGCVLAYAVGWLCTPMAIGVGWRCMFAFGAVMPVLVVLLSVTVMLESPRWLMQSNRNDEAARVIHKLFGDRADVPAIMEEITISLTEEKQAYSTHSCSSILRPTGALKAMLLVGVVSAISQQLVGIEPIMNYMQVIMRSAGETSYSRISWFPLVVGVVKLAVVVAAGIIMDTHGRRQLLIVSFAGIAVTCLGLSAMFHLQYTPSWLVMNALISYVIFFSLGAGPGAWLLASELFSNTVRAKGMSIAAFTNRFFGAIQVTFFLTGVNNVGMASIFAFFGFASLLYTVFFWRFLPETKSQTLEEISEHFRGLSDSMSGPPSGDMEVQDKGSPS